MIISFHTFSAEYLGKSVCQDIWNATANNLDIGQEIRVHADAEDRRRVNRHVRGDLFQLELASSDKIWDGQEFQKFRGNFFFRFILKINYRFNIGLF